jgi:hypothetical protein
MTDFWDNEAEIMAECSTARKEEQDEYSRLGRGIILHTPPLGSIRLD